MTCSMFWRRVHPYAEGRSLEFYQPHHLKNLVLLSECRCCNFIRGGLALKMILFTFLGKCTAVPVHIMMAYRGIRCIAPLIFNLSSRWRWVNGFMLWSLYAQEMDPRTHWIQEWVDPRACLDMVERTLLLCQEFNLVCLAHSPGTPLTELAKLAV